VSNTKMVAKKKKKLPLPYKRCVRIKIERCREKKGFSQIMSIRKKRGSIDPNFRDRNRRRLRFVSKRRMKVLQEVKRGHFYLFVGETFEKRKLLDRNHWELKEEGPGGELRSQSLGRKGRKKGKGSRGKLHHVKDPTGTGKPCQVPGGLSRERDRRKSAFKGQ